MAVVLFVVSYFLIAIFVKSYFKLFRHEDPLNASPEEPYFIGIGWPIYLVYRLIAWPYASGSRFIENKMLEFREKKEKSQVRVSSEIRDKDLEEAEQEVESILSEERSLEL